MSKVIHLVQRARLEIRDVWSLCALCANSVSVSLRYDSPLPENATEDRSKVTCRSCLRLMRFPSSCNRAELQSKVSDTPDFGETWEEREAIAEKTAKIDFGCDFKGNTINGRQAKNRQTELCHFLGKEKDRHDLVQFSERAGNPEPISKALAVAFTNAQIHAR